MSNYVGDFATGQTVRVTFNTRGSAGLVTLTGSPAAAVYRNAGTTESTAGVTLTTNLDGRTGLHVVTVNTAADRFFYDNGGDYMVVLTAGTADGQAVAGTVVGAFSISARGVTADNPESYPAYSPLLSLRTITDNATGPAVDLGDQRPAALLLKAQVTAISGPGTQATFDFEQSSDGTTWSTLDTDFFYRDPVSTTGVFTAFVKPSVCGGDNWGLESLRRYMRCSVSLAGGSPSVTLVVTLEPLTGVIGRSVWQYLREVDTIAARRSYGVFGQLSDGQRTSFSDAVKRAATTEDPDGYENRILIPDDVYYDNFTGEAQDMSQPGLTYSLPPAIRLRIVVGALSPGASVTFDVEQSTTGTGLWSSVDVELPVMPANTTTLYYLVPGGFSGQFNSQYMRVNLSISGNSPSAAVSVTAEGLTGTPGRVVAEWLRGDVNYRKLNALYVSDEGTGLGRVRADVTSVVNDATAAEGLVQVGTDRFNGGAVRSNVWQWRGENASATPPAVAANVPTPAQIADATLSRNLAGGSDGGRTVRDALRAARNRVAFDVPQVGQFTVFREDDTTPAWTGTYTRATTAVNAITATDPA